jgi:hypothetical protein
MQKRLTTGARRGLTVLGVVAVTVFGLGAPSFATAPDLSDTTQGFTDLTTVVTTVLAVAFIGIVVAITAVKMGAKWLKRGASS